MNTLGLAGTRHYDKALVAERSSPSPAPPVRWNWDEFVEQYSLGNWDPVAIPQRPFEPEDAYLMASDQGSFGSHHLSSVESTSETIAQMGDLYLQDIYDAPAVEKTRCPSENSDSSYQQFESPNLSEEQIHYEKYGYFSSPRPPQERMRQIALHRFHLLHTATDVNFDRIAHLAKLVFDSRWVLITLIDEDTQYFKHHQGLELDHTSRSAALCSHAILQPDAQPLVVLDTLKDWRFARNPLVLKKPLKLRFYAGAPIQTDDGFNIGTICLMDDRPRQEFTSSDVETLKELASVTLREMELWHDKIQLRIRDRIQSSAEAFTRQCIGTSGFGDSGSDRPISEVYQRAATLIQRTLEVGGAKVVDVSHFDVLPSRGNSHGESKVYHGDVFGVSTSEAASRNIGLLPQDYRSLPPLAVLGIEDMAEVQSSSSQEPLSGEDHSNLAAFFARHPHGTVFDYASLPCCFRAVVPQNVQYSMIVPIFSNDRPFVLLMAYTTTVTKNYPAEHGLQFLRAIGHVILDAVLRQALALADKSKSFFISNISHELRTPLHGILAAAELLEDTGLSVIQHLFLQTVRACGTSLVEIVNHVLDFSKLSGASKHNRIERSSVDLVSMLEETMEGCWIGSQARQARSSSEIGTVNSAPNASSKDTSPTILNNESVPIIEAILDIAPRAEGWEIVCEKSGIRRVLMNLLGNSLKFTKTGSVVVRLRDISADSESSIVCVELSVIDSGMGMSQDFILNQLFRPFSQENPLNSGTGLGLAIVDSIVKSEGVNGKLDVHSTVGQGTEVRVTFEAEKSPSSTTSLSTETLSSARIHMAGFNKSHPSQMKLYHVLASYFVKWWGARVIEDRGLANIILINEDVDELTGLLLSKNVDKPIVFLTSRHRDVRMLTLVETSRALGGTCHLIFKPCRPSQLFAALKSCTDAVLQGSFTPSYIGDSTLPLSADDQELLDDGLSTIGPSTSAPIPLAQFRTKSTQTPEVFPLPTEPFIISEADTSPQGTAREGAFDRYTFKPYSLTPVDQAYPQPLDETKAVPQRRVLVVEDNQINRMLLTQWLRKKNFEYEEARDGQQAVDKFAARPHGYFHVILMDISMPIMNGVEATRLIRALEDKRNLQYNDPIIKHSDTILLSRSKIFVLSGLASSEDKLQAFRAKIDAYLVKPVSFVTLSTLLMGVHVN